MTFIMDKPGVAGYPINGMKASQGYTLVEVVVAALLSLIMISAFFSIALTSKTGAATEDRKVLGSQAAQSMLQRLANYVASDPNQTVIAGPSSTTPGPASWSLNNFRGCQDSPVFGTVYALAPGVHTITNCNPGALLPADLAANNNTVISYKVAWAPGCYNLPTTPIPANCQPAVQMAVSW